MVRECSQGSSPGGGHLPSSSSSSSSSSPSSSSSSSSFRRWGCPWRWCRARLVAAALLLALYTAAVALLSAFSLESALPPAAMPLNSHAGLHRTHVLQQADPQGPEGHNNNKGVGGGGLGRAFEIGGGLFRGVGGGVGSPRRARLHWCRPLRFMSTPGPVVALVSFPGSGNTWLRYLIQQATGFYTGSVYKDYGLLKNGFPAESVVNGSVAVVKTHESGPAARAPFSRAIILIRSPGPAIHAEFNRQSGGHVGFASPDRYRRNRGKYWQDFVNEKLNTWKKTNLDWLIHFNGPRHVVLYDQLVTNVEGELKAVLSFLNLTPSPSALDCALSRREGIYKRRRRALPFDPYTPSMRAALRRGEEDVMVALRTLLSLTSTTKGRGVQSQAATMTTTTTTKTAPGEQHPPPETLLPPPNDIGKLSPEELLPPADSAG